ncbi:MAG: sulfurtransferase [Rickettsiales bacterium]|nr:sulfurtransferase [Rickettsiales bacterium]|tara:strand:+ start:3804 stop:4121 length:318 start_codon:yes stop_codon:yes gene_type:complete
MNFLEITPTELLPGLKNGSICLIDIREPWEIDICTIEPSLKIPLGQIADRVSEIAKEKNIVFYCHHGVRSLSAVQIMLSHQIESKSLKGGIDLWAEVIDPTCAKY